MTRLLEVWGDTVDSRHLAASVGIGVVIPVPVFLIAEQFFTANVENPALGKSYALLAGLVGCLVAALVAGRLFKPKRIVRAQDVVDEASQRAALDAIVAESGELGDPGDLAKPIQDELHALGLYDVLLADHRRRRETAALEERAPTTGSVQETDPETPDAAYAQGHGK